MVLRSSHIYLLVYRISSKSKMVASRGWSSWREMTPPSFPPSLLPPSQPSFEESEKRKKRKKGVFAQRKGRKAKNVGIVVSHFVCPSVRLSVSPLVRSSFCILSIRSKSATTHFNHFSEAVPMNHLVFMSVSHFVC